VKRDASAGAAIAEGWDPDFFEVVSKVSQRDRRGVVLWRRGILDQLDRAQAAAIAGRLHCDLLEKLPVGVGDVGELAPNPHPAKSKRAHVDHASPDRKGPPSDVQHARHAISNHQQPVGHKRHTAGADVDDLNVKLRPPAVRANQA
jgi:hypothetical protein